MEDSTKGAHASTDNDTGGMTEVQLLRTYLSEQYKNFYDLAMRTAYYLSLNDVLGFGSNYSPIMTGKKFPT